jgi:hypothetical protein
MLRVEYFRFRVWRSGFRVQGSGNIVLGFGIKGSGLMVEG